MPKKNNDTPFTLTALKQLFTSPPIALLVTLNMGLIVALGSTMAHLSGNTEFFLLSLIITVCAGSMVLATGLYLHFTLAKKKDATLLSQTYQRSLMPHMIYNGKELQHPNPAAIEQCWWGTSLDDIQKIYPGLQKILKGVKSSTPKTIEFSVMNNGRPEHWRLTLTPLEAPHFLWTFENISDDTTQKQEASQLEKFFNDSPDGLLSMDDQGHIILCNATFAEWLGYTAEDLVGTPFYKIISEHTRHRSQNPEKISELQGFCAFLTSSQRLKTAYLKQTKVASPQGFQTYSVVQLGEHQDLLQEFDKLINVTPIPVALLDDQYVIQDVNLPFAKAYAQDGTALRHRPFLSLLTSEKKIEVEKAFEHAANGEDMSHPLDIEFDDNEESAASLYISYIEPNDHSTGGFLLHFHDATEQKRMETQLAQSQKMQAVGQLAGGIAHDFNNLLTAMIGFCDLLLQRHGPGDQSFTDIMQIKQNANRAANLVRQLLAFSRQQTLQPRVLHITDTLDELSSLLRRLIGTNIELQIKHTRNLGLVMADQSQFEQVIINLVVNARDAMESGGTVTINTANTVLKRAKRKTKHMDAIPAGDYVLIEVEDTGSGIDPEILSRIFDPFFSTKEKGAGTGLGLSTVYGIVKQTDGYIWIDSKPGKGTKFSVYLPRYLEKTQDIPQKKIRRTRGVAFT